MNDSPTVIIDDARSRHGRVFADPIAIIEADTVAAVEPALLAMQAALDAGHHLAGYFSYELGYVLEPRLQAQLPAARALPLLWFGVFAQAPREQVIDESLGRGRAYAGPLTLEWDRRAYRERFARAAEAIAAGEIYQVNLSMRGHFDVIGDVRALYRDLRGHAGAACGAFIDDGERRILSFSPELFFAVDAARGILGKPMKGTAPRGGDAATDTALRDGLAGDAKERAENVMIVDLVRNDLGRIAETGSVTVRDLFAIETYPTVHQMVSTVGARLRPDATVTAILRALFPCGSVTGAPKIRAMDIIRALEGSPRGVYCGAIGQFAPDGSAQFNVAIRTLTIRGTHGELGVGSGIVSDSRAAAEYAECMLKARYFSQPRRRLRLFETLRWQAGVLVRLDRHLARMQASARELGFPFERAAALVALRNAVVGDSSQAALRVRVTLDEAGVFAASATPLVVEATVWRYSISTQTLTSDDPLLRHKTDWRERYDSELACAVRAGCQEVVFVNERGELCEGSRSNIFFPRDGMMVTPASVCGVLPGCLRQELIERGECVEAVLTRADLDAAEAIYFGNSLHGLVRGLAAERSLPRADASSAQAAL